MLPPRSSSHRGQLLDEEHHIRPAHPQSLPPQLQSNPSSQTIGGRSSLKSSRWSFDGPIQGFYEYRIMTAETSPDLEPSIPSARERSKPVSTDIVPMKPAPQMSTASFHSVSTVVQPPEDGSLTTSSVTKQSGSRPGASLALAYGQPSRIQARSLSMKRHSKRRMSSSNRVVLPSDPSTEPTRSLPLTTINYGLIIHDKITNHLSPHPATWSNVARLSQFDRSRSSESGICSSDDSGPARRKASLVHKVKRRPSIGQLLKTFSSHPSPMLSHARVTSSPNLQSSIEVSQPTPKETMSLPSFQIGALSEVQVSTECDYRVGRACLKTPCPMKSPLGPCQASYPDLSQNSTAAKVQSRQPQAHLTKFESSTYKSTQKFMAIGPSARRASPKLAYTATISVNSSVERHAETTNPPNQKYLPTLCIESSATSHSLWAVTNPSPLVTSWEHQSASKKQSWSPYMIPVRNLKHQLFGQSAVTVQSTATLERSGRPNSIKQEATSLPNDHCSRNTRLDVAEVPWSGSEEGNDMTMVLDTPFVESAPPSYDFSPTASSPRSYHSSDNESLQTPVSDTSFSSVSPQSNRSQFRYMWSVLPALDGEDRMLGEENRPEDDDWPTKHASDAEMCMSPCSDIHSVTRRLRRSNYDISDRSDCCIEDADSPAESPLSKLSASTPAAFSPGNLVSSSLSGHKTPDLETRFYPRCLPASLIDSPIRQSPRKYREETLISDRFIPLRSGIPNKQKFALTQPQGLKNRPIAPFFSGDPFGPVSSRDLRTAEQFVTLRSPSRNLSLREGHTATRANLTSSSPNDVADVAVWSVDGQLVTEGVASTINGRGGRVTSGTCAPHHVADFAQRGTSGKYELLHSSRLAVAMGVDQSAKMLKASSMPRSTGNSPSLMGISRLGNRVWRNGAWESDHPTPRMRSQSSNTRDAPSIPFRVLDAPALRDDFYCSLLAYSHTISCLAVGLGPHVYLWSESRGTRPNTMPESLTSQHGSHITTLSFSSVQGGSAILAIGRGDGTITLWSPPDHDPRFDSEHPAAISCLSFRPRPSRRSSMRDPSIAVLAEDLLVGDEKGTVYYYSVEWPSGDERDLFDWHGSMTLLSRISCHSQQVCGICWTSEGEYFATGGNDNQLLLFETKNFTKTRPSGTRGLGLSTVTRVNNQSRIDPDQRDESLIANAGPGHETRIFHLNAAVKAIAFAPWQPSLLAAGGGSNDRCIHFFHTHSGAKLATIDCHAQVTSLVWSEKRKEIAATFGFAQPEHPYRIAVFSWPSCAMLVSVPWWSEERALFAISYPRGPTGGMDGRQNSKANSEGPAWYRRRTKEEGCIVVATSDASIKFHEIWAESPHRRRKHARGTGAALLGGSQILEGECSIETERLAAIR